MTAPAPSPTPSPSPSPAPSPTPAPVVPAPAPSPSPTPAPAPAPATFHSRLSADLGGHASIKKFATEDELAKGYVNLEKMVAAKGVIPPRDDTPEEWKRWGTELGVPPSADKYNLGEFKPPEGASWDPEFQNRMLGVLHQANLTDRQVQIILGGYAGDIEQQTKGVTDESTAALAAASAELRTEWGQAYAAKYEFAQSGAKEVYGADKTEEALQVVVNGRKLGDNPGAIRVMAALGEKLKEHGLIGPKGSRSTPTPAEAQSEIAKLSADPHFNEVMANKRHAERPGLLARWDLLHQQVQGVDNPDPFGPAPKA